MNKKRIIKFFLFISLILSLNFLVFISAQDSNSDSKTIDSQNQEQLTPVTEKTKVIKIKLIERQDKTDDDIDSKSVNQTSSIGEELKNNVLDATSDIKNK